VPARSPTPVAIGCLVVFAVVWTALAIAPRFRDDWLLENIPTLIVVPVLVLTNRRFAFSDRAYVQLTLFLVLHTVGSHYTYSEVPVGFWVRDALGLARNHYDRLVHFLFGFLLLRPMRELAFGRGAVVDLPTQLVLGVCAVGFASVVYEAIEWVVASIADPAAGTAYLGTQGDPWDAQKDMTLACAGAMLAAIFQPARLPRRALSSPSSGD
jgi:putative membrane protein